MRIFHNYSDEKKICLFELLLQTIGRELFDEAVNDLSKNDIISRTGDKLRLLTPIQVGAD